MVDSFAAKFHAGSMPRYTWLKDTFEVAKVSMAFGVCVQVTLHLNNQERRQYRTIMSRGNTYYAPTGETTEWDDILINKGITTKEEVLRSKGLNPADVSESPFPHG